MLLSSTLILPSKQADYKAAGGEFTKKILKWLRTPFILSYKYSQLLLPYCGNGFSGLRPLSLKQL